MTEPCEEPCTDVIPNGSELTAAAQERSGQADPADLTFEPNIAHTSALRRARRAGSASCEAGRQDSPPLPRAEPARMDRYASVTALAGDPYAVSASGTLSQC